MTREHHVEAWFGHRAAQRFGWQCFTCGKETLDIYRTLVAAEAAADDHVKLAGK